VSAPSRSDERPGIRRAGRGRIGTRAGGRAGWFVGRRWSSFASYLRTALAFFTRPVQIVRTYPRRNLRADLIAGLTVAVVTVPQAMAYALIAELPPEMGLYGAIIGAVVGAMWGSSNQLQTGPTNTASLLALSVLLVVATPGTPEYVVAAGVMAFLVGVFRLFMGLARLGMMVNFISDSVIVGFTAGAGVLIFVNQLRHLLRLFIPSAPNLWVTVPQIAAHLSETHIPSMLIGLITIAFILALRGINRRLPAPLLAMIAAAAVVGLLGLNARGVSVVGELPRGLPPLVKLPLLDVDLIGRLAGGSFAIAAIGLVEPVSIARSISSQTGQRLDSNQEFVGQGLANIACAFTSGYTCSGSFTRSAVNYEAGATSGVASVFASLFVLAAMLLLAPLAAYVPLPALAGVIILTAYGLIDRHEIVRIWQSGSGDRLIMVITLLSTLTLSLQYAVLVGILMSLLYYLIRTSTPRVRAVLPDDEFRHFVPRSNRPLCPQIGIVEILGDLYFGATNHIEEWVLNNLQDNPEQRYLLLRMQSVENCDISGIHTLESIARTYRERGGDLYLVRVRQPVLALMRSSGFYAFLGADHLLEPDVAISHLFYRVIDPAICIYECPVRTFEECQNLPKPNLLQDVRLDVVYALDDVPTVTPRALWDELHGDRPPQVIDVRAPREFRRAHVPDAQSLPLPALLEQIDQVPHGESVVLVCRGGRRSTRATALLREHGYDQVRVLQGGMLAWERDNLLQAVQEFSP
jgi:SulP family sulfate permease